MICSEIKHGAGICACRGVKSIGKPCALIAHARFDEGGQAKAIYGKATEAPPADERGGNSLAKPKDCRACSLLSLSILADE